MHKSDDERGAMTNCRETEKETKKERKRIEACARTSATT